MLRRISALPLFVLLMLFGGALLAPGITPLFAETTPTPPDLTTLTGTVTLPDTTPVTDAEVVATGTGGRVVAPTDAAGAYTLDLVPGSYVVNVRPATLGTTSPTWVFASDPLPLDVPDSGATQDFTVEEASVTVIGRLAAPGGGDFAAPNRAWVRAANQSGRGNTVEVAADGSFSINVLPGAVLLTTTFENLLWSDPVSLELQRYFADAGETVTVVPNPLQVRARTASIRGTVTVLGEDRPAPGGIPVHAWRLDRDDYIRTTTAADGTYTLPVTAGVWTVRANPRASQPYPDDFFTGDEAYYTPVPPPVRVTVPSDDRIVEQGLQVARADALVQGVVVDGSTGLAAFPDDVNGRAYATYRDENDIVRRLDSVVFRGGTFVLPLSTQLADTYSMGLVFPSSSPYTPASKVNIDLTSADLTQSISFPVVTDNATISGTLRDTQGQPVTRLIGWVWAVNDEGGRARTVIQRNGTYELNVATTPVSGQGGSTWRVRAFIVSDGAPFGTKSTFVQVPRVQSVFLPFNDGAGSSATLDFTTAQFDARVQGSVTLPPRVQESAARGVRVVIREGADDRSSAFTRTVYTDRNGNYSVRVPAGDYTVKAYSRDPGDPSAPTFGLIGTPVVAVAVATGETATAPDLAFRASDATVTGTVSYNDAGYPARVRARASDGAVVATTTAEDGSYTLNLLSGVAWEVTAVSAAEQAFLKSDVATVTPQVGDTNEVPPLVLEPTGKLFAAALFAFDAAEEQLLTLDNEAQISIPAGAMGTDAQTTLTARPVAELAGDTSVEPVSFGYRLHAFDSARRPITQFGASITLLIPYTNAQLSELGITAEQLVPAYWDEDSASWQPVDTVVVVPGEDGGTVQITVDHFTDYALLYEVESGTLANSQRVFLPLTVR